MATAIASAPRSVRLAPATSSSARSPSRATLRPAGEGLVDRLHRGDRGGAVPGGALRQVAEQEGVVEQRDAARAEVRGRPVEVAGVAFLVGVDEHEVVGTGAGEARQDVEGGADVD